MTLEERAQSLADWFKVEGIDSSSPLFIPAITLTIKNAIRDAKKCL